MNKFSVNNDKSHVILISERNTSRYSLNIYIGGVKIPHVRSAKCVIGNQLICTDHVNKLSSRLLSRLYITKKSYLAAISTVFSMLYVNRI